MKSVFVVLLTYCGFCLWAETSSRPDLPKTEEEWKARLTPEEFRVLRQGTTECAFMGDLLKEKRSGIYVCAGCESPLFASKAKFVSGTGWPSFLQPVSKEALGTKVDRSYGMVRTEVHCNVCKGHLGHVFEDGPKPSGLRFCINSIALDFVPDTASDKKE